MTESEATEILIRRAAVDDESAIASLMAMHRGKLRRMVAIRMDRRLSARIDPSDVVQDTLVTAVRRLPEFITIRPVAFYPWLRSIAVNRLVDLHRRHLVARSEVCVARKTWSNSICRTNPGWSLLAVSSTREAVRVAEWKEGISRSEPTRRWRSLPRTTEKCLC